MPEPSLLARFVDIFIRHFIRVMKEKRWDMLLAILAGIYFVLIGGLSSQAWKDNIWNLLTPWIWLICSIATVHVIVSAHQLVEQITNEISPIIFPAEHPTSKAKRRKSIPEVPHYRVKVWAMAAIMTLLLVIPSFAAWYIAKSNSMRLSSIHPLPPDKTSPAVPESLRVVIDYMNGEVGMYGARTLYMAYYLLDKIPTLSPIDLAMRVKVINLNPLEPAKIEAWSVETGPTDHGPWTKLSYVPASPYTNIYVVGSVPKKASRLILNDLGHVFDVQPVEQKVEGWAMFECPLPPVCMQTYARIDLRDIGGNDHYTLVNVIEQSRKDQQMNLTERVQARTSKYQSPLDMEKVRVFRPFPPRAYWALPKDEKGVPQGFISGESPLPATAHRRKNESWLRPSRRDRLERAIQSSRSQTPQDRLRADRQRFSSASVRSSPP